MRIQTDLMGLTYNVNKIHKFIFVFLPCLFKSQFREMWSTFEKMRGKAYKFLTYITIF